MTARKNYSFWYRKGLSLTFTALLLFSLAGQIVTGRQKFNAEMQQQ